MTDWKVLDHRVAQMMGFEQKESHGSGGLFWVSGDGEEYLVRRPDSHAWMDWDIWQPHNDVAQALSALDAVVKKGFDTNMNTRHYDSQHEVWVVPAECRGPCWLGVQKQRAKAICLAIEKWLDAQEEL